MNSNLRMAIVALYIVSSSSRLLASEPDIKVSLPAVPTKYERWVAPQELRSKKIIGAGQYSAINVADPDAPTPQFLLQHPDYLANHPFDGVAIPVKLDSAWTKSHGLISNSVYDLHSLVMTKLPIPYSVMQGVVKDLKRVSWGHVTDNFLWYGVRDGTMGGDNDAQLAVDPSSTSDWAIVARNAAVCARVCREAKLKGFIMDTEMYSDYKSGEHYPFGKGTPKVWRQRGQVWIKAVQAEFPAIKILLFFSWGPEHQPGGWPGYENLKYFMNGILDGIKAPARLIHGWEATFWFGGTRIMPGNVPYVYPGDRAAYAQVRKDIKNNYRNFSDNPTKYDKFVDVGMAAWVESDPYNLVPGQPSGFLSQLPWSNLSNTLAYSDEYVWVWSEKTHYPRTREVLNPFLASLANQTFNTGLEAATSLTEKFTSDPLKRGWYFDFDMLNIGRVVHEEFLPAMTTDALAYAWSPVSSSVVIRGTWLTGIKGDKLAILQDQRRRYVHPIKLLSRQNSFQATFDFQIDDFGQGRDNPIILGLFNSGRLVNQHSLAVQIVSADIVRIIAAGDGKPWVKELPIKGGLRTGARYRISFDYSHKTNQLIIDIGTTTASSSISQIKGSIPKTAGNFSFDEVGAAMWDIGSINTPVNRAYQYRLQRVTYQKK